MRCLVAQGRANIGAVARHCMVCREVHDLVRIRGDGAVGSDPALKASAAHRRGAEQGQAVVLLQTPGEDHADDHASGGEARGQKALAEALEHHLYDAQVCIDGQGAHRRVINRREELAEEHTNLGGNLPQKGDHAEVPEPLKVDGAPEKGLEAHQDLHDLHEDNNDQEVSTQGPADTLRGEALVHVAVVSHERAPHLPRCNDPEGQPRVEVWSWATLCADDGGGAEDEDHGLEEIRASP
mmetsp:Transcript_1275/g.2744  ORF Transcript_1275/g.2744 Transcript_1275/m.2744 type:complete len:239 (-) Transcript_1275:1192-1908(-)